MRWDKIGESCCSTARTLSIIGDRWTMLVLRELFLRVRRFDEFQANTGISPLLLTQRLNKLAEHGVVERLRYRDRPPRFEYRLTQKGLELYPIVVNLSQWGDRWKGFEGEPPVQLVHRGCGEPMTPVLSCSACHEPIGPKDVWVELGEEFRAEREAMVEAHRQRTRRKAAS